MIKIIVSMIIISSICSCLPKEPLNDPRAVKASNMPDHEGTLDLLDRKMADLGEWRNEALSSTKITNIKTVMAILRDVESAESDMQVIEKYISEGSVWHFGFDCNFHSVVAFDKAQKAVMVIKW